MGLGWFVVSFGFGVFWDVLGGFLCGRCWIFLVVYGFGFLLVFFPLENLSLNFPQAHTRFGLSWRFAFGLHPESEHLSFGKEKHLSWKLSALEETGVEREDCTYGFFFFL